MSRKMVEYIFLVKENSLLSVLKNSIYLCYSCLSLVFVFISSLPLYNQCLE